MVLSGQIPGGKPSKMVIPNRTLRELGLSGPHEILAKDPRCGTMAIEFEGHGAEDTSRKAIFLSQL